jgi:hypothetical protein
LFYTYAGLGVVGIHKEKFSKPVTHPPRPARVERNPTRVRKKTLKIHVERVFAHLYLREKPQFIILQPLLNTIFNILKSLSTRFSIRVGSPKYLPNLSLAPPPLPKFAIL